MQLYRMAFYWQVIFSFSASALEGAGRKIRRSRPTSATQQSPVQADWNMQDSASKEKKKDIVWNYQI